MISLYASTYQFQYNAIPLFLWRNNRRSKETQQVNLFFLKPISRQSYLKISNRQEPESLEFYTTVTGSKLQDSSDGTTLDKSVPGSCIGPNLIRFHCKRNNLDKAKQALDQMLESESELEPTSDGLDVATFTILIDSYCKKGKLQKAFEVLNSMEKSGCKPNINIYNCLLKGLCYVGRVEESYDMLMKLKNDSIFPDVYSYTAVMNGFCKVGRSNEALELLNEAIKIGLTPNVVTYNTLFDGYCKEGTPIKGFSILKLMSDRNCVPDHITYSTLLNGLLKWRKLKPALAVYKEMIKIGLETDERLINSLFRGLCRESWENIELVTDAYELFDEMSKRKVAVLDSSTYSLFIRTLCMGRKVREAVLLLEGSIRIGIVPRTITFNSVVQALAKEGKVGEAMEILVLMYENGKIPSRTSYDVLIKELNRQGRFVGACNVLGAALKQRVFPHQVPMVRPAKCSVFVD